MHAGRHGEAAYDTILTVLVRDHLYALMMMVPAHPQHPNPDLGHSVMQ
jgi:hypothetical protein